jgi:4-amino-4-deoxy-L-arabinose transferase-like glycosyltransferase
VSADDTSARTWAAQRFAVALGAIALIALAVRLVYALAVAPTLEPRGDTLLYHLMAGALADGQGYVSPASLFRGEPAPTSAYPPLYPIYLAAWSWLGLDSLDAHRAVSTLLGTAAVVLIGLVGRRAGGPLVGLVAAGTAAVYPQLAMVDGTVITESIYAPLVALIVLLALRWHDRPTPGSAAALGAAIGLATLARSEAIALLVLLAAPLVWRTPGRRVVMTVAVTGAAVLVLTPWTVRNWVVQDQPIVLTTNTGLTALATTCESTFHGDRLGWVDHSCAFEHPCVEIVDETDQASCMNEAARAYARDNLGRVPVVVGVRVARLWGLYGQGTDIGYGEMWSRHATAAKAGWVMYGLLVPLAAFGTVVLRRRREPLLPLLAPFLLVTLVAATAFGSSRYRLAAEVPLVVLGAAGVVTLLDWWSARRRGSPGPAPPR